MKTAQEFRAGSVMKPCKVSPGIVLKAEFNKSGRNASVMKMKLKNLLTGATQEPVFKADDKFDQVILERRPGNLLLLPGPAVYEEYNPVKWKKKTWVTY